MQDPTSTKIAQGIAPPPIPDEAAKIAALDEAGLIKLLKSPDAPVFDKAKACQRLAVVGTKDAIPALVALLPDDGSSTNFDRSAINETFKKPFDAALLAERLRTLIGAKKELV